MTDAILTILAHPDDAEFLCGGTLIRLAREKNWQVHIASMTAGDCGSVQYGPEEISRIRKKEGADAAALIGATYHCLEEHDLLVFYNERALDRVTRRIPHLYYADAVEGKDTLGRALPPAFCVDISKVIETKSQMLACHASQRDWLRKHHGMDHYLNAMRDWSAERGKSCGVPFAEGYRQHLGHSYPQDNLLGELLGIVSR